MCCYSLHQYLLWSLSEGHKALLRHCVPFVIPWHPSCAIPSIHSSPRLSQCQNCLYACTLSQSTQSKRTVHVQACMLCTWNPGENIALHSCWLLETSTQCCTQPTSSSRFVMAQELVWGLCALFLAAVRWSTNTNQITNGRIMMIQSCANSSTSWYRACSARNRLAAVAV